MKDFPIFKKRNGQQWKEVSSIYATDFEAAKKEFAQNMTKDNWNASNNIVWLTMEDDGVETGWYDLDSSWYGFVDTEEEDGVPNYKNATHLEVFCLEKDILEGFDSWSEDVYEWELREPINDEE